MQTVIVLALWSVVFILARTLWAFATRSASTPSQTSGIALSIDSLSRKVARLLSLFLWALLAITATWAAIVIGIVFAD